ncbi:MAG: RDD family protein [Bacilli bacterium]|nr:RDD family protein [Bacilli bacterium]
MTASFTKRLVAYIIDILLITFIMALIMVIIPVPREVQLYEEELEVSMQKVLNKEIELDTYASQVYDLTYNMDSAMVGHNIISVVIYILYFIIFQFYNKGRTVGKQIMKIGIVKEEGKLTINDLVLRGIFINGILFNMILLMLILLVDRRIYLAIHSFLYIVHTLFIITSAIFILFNKEKRGLHDIFAHTEVINEK